MQTAGPKDEFGKSHRLAELQGVSMCSRECEQNGTCTQPEMPCLGSQGDLPLDCPVAW